MRQIALPDILVGLVGGSVDLVGIAGNLSMLYSLLHKPADKPMYIILRTMSVTNVLILALNAVFQALPVVWRLTDTMPSAAYQFAYRYGHYMWITAMATHFVKVWLTVLLSVERWIAVCRPLAFNNCLLMRRVRWLIGLIALVSVLFTIPRGFENECVQTSSSSSNPSDSRRNDNSSNRARLCEWKITDLAKSSVYAYAYGVAAYAVCVFLLPVCTTLALNGHIIIEIKRGKRTFANLSIMQKYERRISKIPLAVAVVFCILQTPAMLVNLFEFAGLAKALGIRHQVWRSLLAGTAVLTLVDSSADFIVYFYNISCTKSPSRLRHDKQSSRSRSRSNGESRSPTNANRSSSNVCLNEVTTRKLLLVRTSSHQHLSIKTTETSSCKNFSFNLL